MQVPGRLLKILSLFHNRVATARGKHGIWMFIFPDREFAKNYFKNVFTEAMYVTMQRKMFIATKIFNTAVTDFGAKKSARCNGMLVTTEHIKGGTILTYTWVTRHLVHETYI